MLLLSVGQIVGGGQVGGGGQVVVVVRGGQVGGGGQVVGAAVVDVGIKGSTIL